MEQAVDNLDGALETHYEKWMKAENAEILRKTEVTAFTTPEPPMGAEKNRFNPAIDLKQAFLAVILQCLK